MLSVLKTSITTLEGELAKVKSREQQKTATLTKEIALLQYTCEEHSSSVQVWAGEARQAAAESNAAIVARLISTEARVATVAARAGQLAATLSKRRVLEVAEREREAAERERASVLHARVAAETAEASLSAAEEARAALADECRGLRASLAAGVVAGTAGSSRATQAEAAR